MGTPIYQVDAFASERFRGNPAAVVLFADWPDEALLQSIAMENNLAETAYVVANGDRWELRWFTPQVEVALCGHATLAAAHVLFEHLQVESDEVVFCSASGALRVSRSDSGLTLDFPSVPVSPVEVDYAVCQALGLTASEALLPDTDPSQMLYVYEFESDIVGLAPDFRALADATQYAIIATAPGEQCDFVSRFFAPRVGVDEDSVTGSAHCAAVPYWAARQSKTSLLARQLSARGGELDCELRDGRVFMTGQAVTYFQGTLEWLS
ncbi:MAG: PhzF family phenazine biosynthesis protein [Pseudomonadota bacterium]